MRVGFCCVGGRGCAQHIAYRLHNAVTSGPSPLPLMIDISFIVIIPPDSLSRGVYSVINVPGAKAPSSYFHSTSNFQFPGWGMGIPLEMQLQKKILLDDASPTADSTAFGFPYDNA